MKLREEMANDPLYSSCLRYLLLQDHECECNPRNGQMIEWEHAIVHASKQLNEKWAIIPLCWWSHSGPGMVKEINEWIALNRATDEQLEAISKAIDYKHKRDYLNSKYGDADLLTQLSDSE